MGRLDLYNVELLKFWNVEQSWIVTNEVLSPHSTNRLISNFYSLLQSCIRSREGMGSIERKHSKILTIDRHNEFLMTKSLSICITLFALSLTSCGYRDSQYFLDRDPWTQQAEEFRQDCHELCILFGADENVKNTELRDFYMDQYDEVYVDRQGNRLKVLPIEANNGMPYSIEPFRYVRSDGMIAINWGKIAVLALWYFNIFCTPVILLVIIAVWLYKQLRIYLKQQ